MSEIARKSPLGDLWEQFMADRRILRGLSPATIRYYQSSGHAFAHVSPHPLEGHDDERDSGTARSVSHCDQCEHVAPGPSGVLPLAPLGGADAHTAPGAAAQG